MDDFWDCFIWLLLGCVVFAAAVLALVGLSAVIEWNPFVGVPAACTVGSAVIAAIITGVE